MGGELKIDLDPDNKVIEVTEQQLQLESQPV